MKDQTRFQKEKVLAGVYRGGHDALVRAKLAMSDSGVTMQLTVRSTDPYVSEVLVTAIG